jgi:hypothetical protein
MESRDYMSPSNGALALPETWWIEDDMEVWIQGSLDTGLEDGVGYHGIC